MKKSHIILTIFILSCSLYFSCNNKKATTNNDVETALLWKQNCALCHGKDGKLGLNGAKDLRESTLSLAPRIEIIKKGKGKMIGFENALSEEEITALAKFTFSFQ